MGGGLTANGHSVRLTGSVDTIEGGTPQPLGRRVFRTRHRVSDSTPLPVVSPRRERSGTSAASRRRGDSRWTSDNARDYAALTPLIWSHVNPYGRFDLDMNPRMARA